MTPETKQEWDRWQPPILDTVGRLTLREDNKLSFFIQKADGSQAHGNRYLLSRKHFHQLQDINSSPFLEIHFYIITLKIHND